jgi:hypothetical membrane protein
MVRLRRIFPGIIARQGMRFRGLSPFERRRRAVAVAVLLAAGAMLRYPGGTLLDRATSSGYSLSANFLSDLGMTVAYDGQRNFAGATLFVLSLLLLVVGLGGCVFGFVHLYATSLRSKPWARTAAVFAALACVAFAGVAVTPENAVMNLHVMLTLWAWRLVPGVALLLCVASALSDALPPRVAFAWGALAAVLATYVAVLTWGPSTATAAGLREQVIAQKIIAASVVAFLIYLSCEADRITAPRPGLAQRS